MGDVLLRYLGYGRSSHLSTWASENQESSCRIMQPEKKENMASALQNFHVLDALLIKVPTRNFRFSLAIYSRRISAE